MTALGSRFGTSKRPTHLSGNDLGELATLDVSHIEDGTHDAYDGIRQGFFIFNQKGEVRIRSFDSKCTMDHNLTYALGPHL